MSDERMKRILARQKEQEERLRQKEQANKETLLRLKEEEKKKEFEKKMDNKQWKKDETGKWVMISDKNLAVDYDPVKPPRDLIFANSKSISDMESEFSKVRWKKVDDSWETSEDKALGIRSLTSKELHKYRAPVTSSELPLERYKALKIVEAVKRSKDRAFAADLFELIISTYMLHSPFSTQNAILKDAFTITNYLLTHSDDINSNNNNNNNIIIIDSSSNLNKDYRNALMIYKIIKQLKRMETYLKNDTEIQISPKFYEFLEKTAESCKSAIDTIETYYKKISTHSEEEMEENIVLSLPEEILLEIFSYLPLYDLYQCSMVSKNWNRVANDGRLYFAFVSKKFIYMKYSMDVNWKLQLRQSIGNKYTIGGMNICENCNQLYWNLDNEAECAYGIKHSRKENVDLHNLLLALQTSPP